MPQRHLTTLGLLQRYPERPILTHFTTFLRLLGENAADPRPLNAVCDPPLSWYLRNYSILAADIATTPLADIATVQPAGQCYKADDSVSNDDIVLAIGVVVGVGLAAFAAAKCVAMVRAEQKAAGEA